MVASPLHIFSLCRLMSSDGANAFVSHSFSQAVPLSTVVFLILVDRKLFLLPPFPACPWQAYFLHSVCGVVCTGVRARTYMCVCMCVFVPMYVCMYVCVHTSVKQKLLSCQCQVWRMVPLVKDSFSHCTGLPTLFRRAKCLYLMLDLCYLSMKLQLRTSYTFGTGWVISSIPPCGHEHKWSGLVLCHPILSLTCYQPTP